MPKFKVEIVETYRRYVEVEAEDEDAAYQEINDKIAEGEIDLPCDGEDYKYDRELFVSEIRETINYLCSNCKFRCIHNGKLACKNTVNSEPNIIMDKNEVCSDYELDDSFISKKI